MSRPHGRDTACDLQKSKSCLLYFNVSCGFFAHGGQLICEGLVVEHHPTVLFHTSPGFRQQCDEMVSISY